MHKSFGPVGSVRPRRHRLTRVGRSLIVGGVVALTGAASVSTVLACSTTTTTVLSAGPISVGSSVYDTATVTTYLSATGGTVTFTIYTDDTCTDLATTQISGQPVAVSVIGSGPYSSGPVSFNQAGTYYWDAAYSGTDPNSNPASNSGCSSEPLTVTALSPTISTTLSATAIPVDTSAYDTATLSGATPDASGTVTYQIYTENTGNTCTDLATTQISGQPAAVTVTSGNVPDSAAVTFTQTGTYYWQATYSGDTNNNRATSTCTSETVTVTALSPTISTTLSATAIPVDTSAYDTATLSGATPDASGTVTYQIYTEDTCTELATTQISGQPAAVTVTHGNVPDSAAVTFTQTGTYYWQATYSGDTNNNRATSTCTSEPFSVATGGALAAISTPTGGVLGITTPSTGAGSTAGGWGWLSLALVLLGGALLVGPWAIRRARIKIQNI